mmetsp:Transcript_8270/g.11511  ORF Transcript_8270/g.11511 Transcript_8270/m.11511 type:complete len:276 (-) Transcript_8270:484-1311(-)
MAHLSLSATQADNFYIPSGWDPKEGSLAKFVGNKGRDQFERRGIIRLELPFDCWCDGCSRPLGKGTRFNSTKKAVGKYYSTTLWLFEFKCPSCSSSFELRTDPKNSDYICASSLRRKLVPQQGDNVLYETNYRERDAAQRLAANPINKLERENDDRKRALSTQSQLESIQRHSTKYHQYDADTNSILRERHRTKRKLVQKLEAKNLGVQILPFSSLDTPEYFRRQAAHSLTTRKKSIRPRHTPRLKLTARPKLPSTTDSPIIPRLTKRPRHNISR